MNVMGGSPIPGMTERRTLPLAGGWSFRRAGDETWMPASIPGSNFTDLRLNGVIGDPDWRDNELELQWIEKEDWEYRCAFDLTAGDLECDSLELVFEGLDTYCEVSLNGSPLLSAEDMFCTYRAECRPLLKPDSNELRLFFRSPVTKGSERRAADGFVYPAENDRTEDKVSAYVRKAAYHFGWDWGPKFVTSGVWRPVHLDRAKTGRIRDIAHEIVGLDDDVATVAFTIEVEAFHETDATIELTCAEVGVSTLIVPFTLHSGSNLLRTLVTVQSPKLWWPNGLGEPFLYHLTAALKASGNVIDSKTVSVGLRTIEVIREPDEHGESFFVKVNGRPVFMKGANVIPLDSFYEQVTPDSYQRLFRDVVDANMNMLRVWGGGVYESDLFYDLADSHGILIWQDFMFSCTLYPSDEHFLKLVAKEARQVVRRLRGHACLALWCGNNEIDLGIAHWDWPEKFGYSEALFDRLVRGNSAIFHELLPGIVQDLDPGRSYIESSPIGFWNDPADDGRGDGHYWGVWHAELPFQSYEERLSRFMSEFGFQSYPLLESIARFTFPEDRQLDSEVLSVHQKHPRGNTIIERFVRELCGEPRSFEHFCYLSQVVQADGLRIAFEAHRRAMPFCMGSLYWQLNDCWPAISWSSIDYYGQWKALHYQAARSFRPVILSLESRGGIYRVHAVSDLVEDVHGQLVLELMTFEGQTLWRRERQVLLKSASAAVVAEFSADDIGRDLANIYLTMRLTSDGREVTSAGSLLAPLLDQMLPDPQIAFEPVGDRGVRLTARRFARAVHVSAERVDGGAPIVFDENFFDMNAGEIRTIEVRGGRNFDPSTIKVVSLIDALKPSALPHHPAER
jgi:beta-mannosidase